MGNCSIDNPAIHSVRHILYVAYPLLPVSDESCGGAEQMLSVLEAEMAARGFCTAVAGCAGSRASGTVFATGRESSQPDSFAHRNAEHERYIVDLLAGGNGLRRHFDLVHDKSGSFWRLADCMSVPVLATLHLPRHFYARESFGAIPANVYFNCVSVVQAKSFADIPNVIRVVRNGIRVQQFAFRPDKQDYLLWMGRICEEKGSHLAIEVARRTGLPLILAGQVYPFTYHQTYYSERIRPHLADNRAKVSFFETPAINVKMELLANARALLVPSLVDETSSLVSMEAMACGTPVIGFRRGAIPEVVSHGVTGLIVDDVEQMAEAVRAASAINPYACRTHVEGNYSSVRMATEYEELYEQILSARERS